MSRASHLKRTYGITVEQYEELLDKQSGNCFVCERHHSKFPRRLAVDHNHKTGEIRGLLCTYCNQRVIGRHTDSKLLLRAGEYLSQGTGWFVPPDKRTGSRKKKKKVVKPMRT